MLWSLTLASSPGSTQFFNAFQHPTLKNWMEPGDEASLTLHPFAYCMELPSVFPMKIVLKAEFEKMVKCLYHNKISALVLLMIQYTSEWKILSCRCEAWAFPCVWSIIYKDAMQSVDWWKTRFMYYGHAESIISVSIQKLSYGFIGTQNSAEGKLV